MGIGRLYLLALVTGAAHGKPVPHLQPQRVYAEILNLPARPARSCAEAFHFMTEDAWFDEQDLVKHRRPRRAHRRNAAPGAWDEELGVLASPAISESELERIDDLGSGVSEGDGHETEGRCESHGGFWL